MSAIWVSSTGTIHMYHHGWQNGGRMSMISAQLFISHLWQPSIIAISPSKRKHQCGHKNEWWNQVDSKAVFKVMYWLHAHTIQTCHNVCYVPIITVVGPESLIISCAHGWNSVANSHLPPTEQMNHPTSQCPFSALCWDTKAEQIGFWLRWCASCCWGSQPQWIQAMDPGSWGFRPWRWTKGFRLRPQRP